MLGGAILAAGAASAGALQFSTPTRLIDDANRTLSPPEALAAVGNGTVILIDIRRPDEWARTGVAQGAVPIDMRRDDFADTVAALHAANPDVRLAFICARGVRSRNVIGRLEDVGIQNTLDVPEGMLGSSAGPGWLKRGIPVVPYAAADS